MAVWYFVFILHILDILDIFGYVFRIKIYIYSIYVHSMERCEGPSKGQDVPLDDDPLHKIPVQVHTLCVCLDHVCICCSSAETM